MANVKLGSSSTRGRTRYLPKWAWTGICVSSIPLGGIIYLAIGRTR